MKKEEEDIPVHYFERNLLFVAVFVAITGGLGYYTYIYFAQVHPLAFIVGIPTMIFLFQTLWLLLNPFAVIYKDKFEIKRTLLSNKIWYFIDIKCVGDVTSKGFTITYNDGEVEVISTFGIRASHQKEFRGAVNKYVCKSLVVDRDE